jgi:hypothetical protein
MENNTVPTPVGHYKSTVICKAPYIAAVDNTLHFTPPVEYEDVPLYSKETVHGLLAELLEYRERFPDYKIKGKFGALKDPEFIRVHNDLLVYVQSLLKMVSSEDSAFRRTDINSYLVERIAFLREYPTKWFAEDMSLEKHLEYLAAIQTAVSEKYHLELVSSIWPDGIQDDTGGSIRYDPRYRLANKQAQELIMGYITKVIDMDLSTFTLERIMTAVQNDCTIESPDTIHKRVARIREYEQQAVARYAEIVVGAKFVGALGKETPVEVTLPSLFQRIISKIKGE